MKIVVFDTETTSLEKPFCYNIGFCIIDTDLDEILVKRDYVVEQIWHNIPLFSTAYYADKRPIYVSRMKGKACKMEKFGYITQEMCRLFKAYEIECAYAYNSSFDEKVFNFNCDYFKCINPFDNIPIFDIRGLVHRYIAFDKNFQDFCDHYDLYTESGHYSTTAETLFRYITQNVEFDEEHTALADSEIEYQILKECINRGGEYNVKYKTYRSIVRECDRVLRVIEKKTKRTTEFKFRKIRIAKDKSTIWLD